MCTPAGGCGSTRPLPGTRFGWRHSLQNNTAVTSTASTKIRTGSIATTLPQSGMTNLLVSSRIPFQKSSNMEPGQSFGEPAISTYARMLVATPSRNSIVTPE